jgi:hypothetical protein
MIMRGVLLLMLTWALTVGTAVCVAVKAYNAV